MEDEDEKEEEEDDDDDWGGDDDWEDDEEDHPYGDGDTLDEERGDGDVSDETDLSGGMEEEEEEEELGRSARGRAHGRSPRKPIKEEAYGSARSNGPSNRRAHNSSSDGGRRATRGRGAGPSPSGRQKAKAKGGVMKSVGKATGSSMKAMVHALQPKSVGLGEILDTWKIEQV